MANDRASVKVVCDAGPLIHLDELGCIDLLADFEAVLLPEQVQREVESHRASALRNPGVLLQQLDVNISGEPFFQSLVRALALDTGEQAALSLLLLHPEAILLTDDAAARVAAKALGHEVHGTIGVLLRAVRRFQRSRAEVLASLRAIPHRSTLHIRPRLLDEIIGEIDEGGP